MSQTQWLKPTEMYSFTVLKGRIQNQGTTLPPGTFCRKTFLDFPGIQQAVVFQAVAVPVSGWLPVDFCASSLLSGLSSYEDTEALDLGPTFH